MTQNIIKKETNCGDLRLTIKRNKKNSFWKMTRPKEMDMLHLYYLHLKPESFSSILNINNKDNICDKNNTNIYVKAFESWVTRISIVVVVSA